MIGVFRSVLYRLIRAHVQITSHVSVKHKYSSEHLAHFSFARTQFVQSLRETRLTKLPLHLFGFQVEVSVVPACRCISQFSQEATVIAVCNPENIRHKCSCPIHPPTEFLLDYWSNLTVGAWFISLVAEMQVNCVVSLHCLTTLTTRAFKLSMLIFNSLII